MLSFNVTDRVSFHPPGHDPKAGVIVKYNRKTVTVVTDDQHQWNVAAVFLSCVVDADSVDSSSSRVVQLPIKPQPAIALAGKMASLDAYSRFAPDPFPPHQWIAGPSGTWPQLRRAGPAFGSDATRLASGVKTRPTHGGRHMKVKTGTHT